MNIAVLVSGGGTNLQAIVDRIDNQTLRGVRIVSVISSSHTAYALERAQKYNIPSRVISKKDYADLDAYDGAMLDKFDALIAPRGLGWKIRDILPDVLLAGDNAGKLTANGAALLGGASCHDQPGRPGSVDPHR